MRCGEFTINSTCDYDKVIHIEDVVITGQSGYTLHLRGSKTDPYHAGILICTAGNDYVYIHSQKDKSRSLKNQTQDADNLVLSRNQFISYLRHLLVLIGLNDKNYNGHSFRISAATTAVKF